MIINDLTFSNRHDLVVAHQHFNQPVAVAVVIEKVVRFLQMMDFVLIDGFQLFAFLAVLVVGVFDHLVAGLIDTAVYLVTIVVVFEFDGLEHPPVRFILHNFHHLSVLVVLVLRVHGVVAHGLCDTGDVANAVGVVGERDGDAVAVEDLFATEEVIAVVQVFAASDHDASGVVLLPAGGQGKVVVVVIPLQQRVFLLVELDKLEEITVGGVLLSGDDIRLPPFQQLGDVGSVLHHNGVLGHKIGARIDDSYAPIDVVALQVVFPHVGGDDDGVGLLFAADTNRHQQ